MFGFLYLGVSIYVVVLILLRKFARDSLAGFREIRAACAEKFTIFGTQQQTVFVHCESHAFLRLFQGKKNSVVLHKT